MSTTDEDYAYEDGPGEPSWRDVFVALFSRDGAE
jgi:hypothetical protein